MLVGVLADWNAETMPGLGLATVLERWVIGGAFAGAYLAAAFGYGVAIGALLRIRGGCPPALAMAIGLGVMLTLSHALGVAGLLNATPVGRAAAIGSLIPGIVLALRWGVTTRRTPTRSDDRGSFGAARRWLMLATMPAVAVLMVASAVPPGWIWGSEFSGYDTLSYHLQLPQEWLEDGRLWPLAHNVYSFLPGYAEAAWLHLGALAFAPAEPGGFSAPRGLLTGAPIYAAQILSAMVTLIAAWLVGAATAALLDRSRGTGDTEACSLRRVAPWLAGAITVATPWSVVTGSMAYHEMYVVALGAGAMLAALHPGVSIPMRWGVAAALVGVACGCKATAILLVTPPVGMSLLWTTRLDTPTVPIVRAFAQPVLIGIVAGLVTLSPWLVRNAAAVGNPVFPFASQVFGHGHWLPEQHARFAAAHAPDGSAADRVRTMFLPEPEPPDLVEPMPVRQRHRGLLHPQWSVLFPVGVIALGAAIRSRATRAPGAWLAVALAAQLGAWLVFTHVQSRFLLPTLIVLAPGVALGFSILGSHRLGVRLASGLVLALSGTTAFLFVTERDGHPVMPLIAGVDLYTGELARKVMPELTPEEQAEVWRDQTPTARANLQLASDSRLVLLGDSTPFYLRVPFIYRTTWDTWPVGEEVGVPMHRWSHALIDAGATHALVNLAELNRLSRSGYTPPGVDGDTAGLWLTLVQEEQQGTFLRIWANGTALLELHADRVHRPGRAP